MTVPGAPSHPHTDNGPGRGAAGGGGSTCQGDSGSGSGVRAVSVMAGLFKEPLAVGSVLHTSITTASADGTDGGGGLSR